MADAMLVLHERAGRKWVGINGQILRSARHGDNAFIAVRVSSVAGVYDAMVDLILQGLKSAGLDLIANKYTERFSVVKCFSLTFEMLFKFVPLF